MITTWLTAADRDDDRWPLIATELVVNAIEAMQHAGEPDTMTIRVEMRAHDHHVEMAVTNPGPPIPTVDDVMPDEKNSRGRGLAMVQRLTDHLEVSHDDGRTCVRCTLDDVAGPAHSDV
jgi:anti-sigma regulatory factor (Ser/Thr protein kinase)